MAYFRCVGGVGGGAVLTLTYSSEFYGETITATDGTKTVTKVAPSTGTMDITLPESGTWVVSATIDGQTYSTTVTVDLEYTATLEAIPNGSTVTPTDDIQTWLKCAGITDKTTYTTLADVLADTDTFIALCADSNACDYMARSTNWASGVSADSTAMLIVGKYNYCANALLGNSTWSEALVNSTYWAYVFDVTVPKMTSNSAPSGLAFASSTYDSNYPAYKAFNGDSSNGWNARANPVYPEYLGYIFTQKMILSEIALDTGGTRRVYTFKIQGSNDTTTGTDGTWTDVSEVITTPDSGYNKTYPINGDGEYKAYRLYIVTGTTSAGNLNIATLQFYGRTDNANYIPLVPVMTSNTTPSGEAISYPVHSSSSYAPYKAFDGDDTTLWSSDAVGSAGQWLRYTFDSAMTVQRIMLKTCNVGTSVIKIQGSNDGFVSDINDLVQATVTSLTTYNFDIPDVAQGNYESYRLYFVSTTGNSNSNSIYTLQFYRKSDLPIIHSAVEDNIFYMNDGSPVALCGIPVGDTIDVDLEAYKGQTLTLVSTVAKDPTNLSNDFSMNVRITPNITEIYLMPIKYLYWWGNMSDNCEELSNANGWNYGFTYQSPTFNKNDVFARGGSNIAQGIGSKYAINGTTYNHLKYIVKSNNYYSGAGVVLGALSTKGGTTWTAQESPQSISSPTLITVDISSYASNFALFWANGDTNRYGALNAFWYE